MASASSKSRILDCADRVVLRDGVAHLTLDAVAAEAGLSKGGVLYNFPTKEDLIRGMIARMMGEFEGEIARLEAEDPEPRGRALRAFVRASFPEADSPCQKHTKVAACLLAAVLVNPVLLDPLREQSRKMQDRLFQDGLDPARVHIVRLAADGLWMSDLFAMPGPVAEARREVLQKLCQLTRE
jgi:AcrR family transcriptional regulator